MSLMDAAEDVTALAAELGVRRELLYKWRRNTCARARRLAADRPPVVHAGAVGAPAASRPEDAAAAAQRRIEELERKIGQQQLDLDFFRAALRHVREPARRRAILARRHLRGDPCGDGAARRSQGIERMCALAGVSRASYYRHWLASKPREEETALRDEIQRLSLAQRKTAIGTTATGRSRFSCNGRAGW